MVPRFFYPRKPTDGLRKFYHPGLNFLNDPRKGVQGIVTKWIDGKNSVYSMG